MEAGIEKQIITIDYNEPATLQIISHINQPFRLASADVTLTPPGKISYYVITQSTQCVNNDTDTCLQNWNTDLYLVKGICTLDGDYRLNWTTICNEKDCGLTLSSDREASVLFSVKSENFCAQIAIDIGLFGNITVYQYNNFSSPKTVFTVNNTAYFLVTVNSEFNESPYNVTNALVEISQTKLKTVVLRPLGDNPIRIYENGDPNRNELNLDFKVIKKNEGNMVGFSIVYSKQLAQYFIKNGNPFFIYCWGRSDGDLCK
jgi:hypothetical protein